jgi:hypothetical protein
MNKPPVLDNIHCLSVGDLDLDPDLGVHRHLPQSRPVRLGQGPVFLFVLFIPLIGVLAYLIARGGSMHERQLQR